MILLPLLSPLLRTRRRGTEPILASSFFFLNIDASPGRREKFRNLGLFLEGAGNLGFWIFGIILDVDPCTSVVIVVYTKREKFLPICFFLFLNKTSKYKGKNQFLSISN